MRRVVLFVLLALCFRANAQSGLGNQWVAFDRAGASNSNKQCFSPKNVSLRNGYLAIETRSEMAVCKSIDLWPNLYRRTSGFIATRSFQFLYGTLEFRAKFGGGSHSGSWPTIWLSDGSCQASDPTGTDDACNGQEIDVAEILGGDFRKVNEQIHINNFTYNDGCTASVPDTSKDFHVYQLVWSKGMLVFKIDGSITCTIKKPYVPDAPMYPKISVYVGGYGGDINDRTLPWETLIDYIRITRDGQVLFDDEFDGAQNPGTAQGVKH